LGKPTLPIIHLLAHAGSTRRPALLARLQGVASNDGHAGIAAALRDAGSIDYARTTAHDHVNQALAALDLLPPSTAKSALAALAEFIVQRDR
jgi:geranylgeranyl pyrophosphate synthase